jgi:hypothetical protein
LSTSAPTPEKKQPKIQLRNTVGNMSSDRPAASANSSSPSGTATIAKRTSSVDKANSLKEQQESQLKALRNMPNIRQKRAGDVPVSNAPAKPTTEIEAPNIRQKRAGDVPASNAPAKRTTEMEANAKVLKEIKEEETRRKLEQLESALDFSLEMELGFLVVDSVEPQDELSETNVRPNIRQVAPKVRKVPEMSVLVVNVVSTILVSLLK